MSRLRRGGPDTPGRQGAFLVSAGKHPHTVRTGKYKASDCAWIRQVLIVARLQAQHGGHNGRQTEGAEAGFGFTGSRFGAGYDDRKMRNIHT
jgi:hypothetical protein